MCPNNNTFQEEIIYHTDVVASNCLHVSVELFYFHCFKLKHDNNIAMSLGHTASYEAFLCNSTDAKVCVWVSLCVYIPGCKYTTAGVGKYTTMGKDTQCIYICQGHVHVYPT